MGGRQPARHADTLARAPWRRTVVTHCFNIEDHTTTLELINTLVTAADQALHTAKAAGRNMVRAWD